MMKVRETFGVVVIAIGVGVLATFAVKGIVNHAYRVTTAESHEPKASARTSTPADVRVQAAEKLIRQASYKPDGYNRLAAAFMQKARETGDFGFNARAEAALGRSLELAADNYDAIKLRAKLLLTYHRFSEALEVTRHAQRLRPDDHDVYGAMTDALVELGDYEGAIEAAQKMVDLRPDSSSYARVSYLRSLHGDVAGAIEAMRVAVKAADPNDPEGSAWCRVHLGDELLNDGKLIDADREYDKALFTFPNYPLALAAKGRLQIRKGDLPGALKNYERAQLEAPLPEIAVALGNLYASLGLIEEAKRQYELVEFIERTGASANTYSRQLSLFWADHDLKLDEALAIAQRERSTRQDIFTCDALAWALFKNDRLDEAKQSITQALRLGTRDAHIFYHAGMIYNSLGDTKNAFKYLKLALKTDPTFDLLQAEKGRQALNTLNHRTSIKHKSIDLPL
jgi:tetratricopeptide (TPR) repeat protein